MGRLHTIKSMLQPNPQTTPILTNKPPTLLVVNPLKMLPPPSRDTPTIAVALAPIFLITPAFASAQKEINAQFREPMKEIVDGDESFLSTRAACMIPHE